MELISRIALAVFCVALLVIGALLLQTLRYEYNTQFKSYTIRIDKLTGEICFIPLGIAGARVANQVLVIEQCD